MDINVYAVIRKLIGPVVPIGEQHTDDKRLENLEELIGLMDLLVADLLAVSVCTDRQEYSMKKAGDRAEEFLQELHKVTAKEGE